MPHRATTLLSTIVISIGIGCAPDVSDCSTERETVDLGIDTDLSAIVHLDLVSGERHYAFLAVGADGTAVTWGLDYSDGAEEPIVEVFDLGDAHLRGAWIDKSSGSGPSIWWVVGDGGQIMSSSNLGETWDSVELPSGADLYGISGVDGRPIVVGDDVVAMRNIEDGTWTELTPPTGGWGQLRGVFAQYTRVDVVGLGGVIWSSDDASGEWTQAPSGVTADLFAVDYDVAVGAGGTLLLRDDAGWTPADTGVDVDLVDYEGGYALGANGEIYKVAIGEPLSLIDTIPDARGVTNVWETWATVGDGGSVSSPPANCY